VDPRVLRAGGCEGRVLAANIVTAKLHTGDEDAAAPFAGSILFVEAAHIRLAELDHMLQRLLLIGVFDVLAGLVMGVPVQVLQSNHSLELEEIMERAFGRSAFPVLLDAFCGSGYPSLSLKIGAPAVLSVSDAGSQLEWV
jgi:muramoyltetrapeptide carboxypeptidase LdcA involved in peptidoglycan recycling